MRKTKLQSVEIPDEEGAGEIMDEIKETKFDNLLNYLRDYEQDFTCTIYKKKERNKRVLVAKFDNYLPDPIEDLQIKYGGGDFRIMIHSGGELLDSADISVDIVEETMINPLSGSRKEIIEEIKSMSEIIRGGSGGADKNEILLKIIEMQNQMSERFTKLQIESEKRTTDLIMSMQSKKPALGEILEVIQFVDEIKGDRGAAPENVMEQIMKNPLAQPLIEMLKNKMLSPAPVTAAAPPETVKQISKTPSIEDYINSLPEDFKSKITKESSEYYINELYDKNKNVIDKTQAEAIINEIISRKG